MQPAYAMKRGPRWPIIMAAMGQLTGALATIAVSAHLVIPPRRIEDWVVIGSIALLLASSATLVIPQPWSWRMAILAQIPLLGVEGLVVLGSAYYFSREPHRGFYAGMAALIIGVAAVIAFPLALCSLTALLQLLRPRTRLAYGVPVGK